MQPCRKWKWKVKIRPFGNRRMQRCRKGKWKWYLLEIVECSGVESESEKWKWDLLEIVECSGVEKESSEEKSRNGSNDEIDCAGHLGWMALVVCYPFLLVFFVINFYWCYLRWLVVIIFYWFLSLLIVLWAEHPELVMGWVQTSDDAANINIGFIPQTKGSPKKS